MSRPRRHGAAANSSEAARGAAAYRALAASTGGCGELLGWRWCCCGDGEATRPAGDWQRRWRRAALLLRALRAMKEEPEMRKWRRGQERAVAGVIMASSGASWPAWSRQRRRAAIAASTRWPCPSDGRPLNQPVQFVSERDFEPDSEFTRRLNCQTVAP